MIDILILYDPLCRGGFLSFENQEEGLVLRARAPKNTTAVVFDSRLHARYEAYTVDGAMIHK